jgi:hypothetical protein
MSMLYVFHLALPVPSAAASSLLRSLLAPLPSASPFPQLPCPSVPVSPKEPLLSARLLPFPLSSFSPSPSFPPRLTRFCYLQASTNRGDSSKTYFNDEQTLELMGHGVNKALVSMYNDSREHFFKDWVEGNRPCKDWILTKPPKSLSPPFPFLFLRFLLLFSSFSTMTLLFPQLNLPQPFHGRTRSSDGAEDRSTSRRSFNL